MKFRHMCIFCCIVLLSLAAIGSSGQSTEQPKAKDAIINFQVFDSASGYAIGGATIKWGSVSNPMPKELPNVQAADQNGSLSLRLPLGEYAFEFTAPGYKSMRSTAGFVAEVTVPWGIAMDPIEKPQELRDDVVNPQLREGEDLVHGFVVDSVTRHPIPGVKVSLGRGKEEDVTDARGYYRVYVQAESQEHNMRPEDLPPPDRLVASAPGYKRYVVDGMMYAPGGYEVVNITMEPGQGETHEDTTPGALRNGDRDYPPPDKQKPLIKHGDGNAALSMPMLWISCFGCA